MIFIIMKYDFLRELAFPNSLSLANGHPRAPMLQFYSPK